MTKLGPLTRRAGVEQDGVVLAWRSADPELVAQEVGGPIAGKTVVDVSAGKYRTAVVTSDGDIFMWEGWSKPLEAGTAATATRGAGGKEAALQAALLGKSPDAPRCAPRAILSYLQHEVVADCLSELLCASKLFSCRRQASCLGS